jgi:hypothetical protein
MKFPKKIDGSLDFNAFCKLPKEQQKEAVTDLKATGTPVENQALLAFAAEGRRKQQEVAEQKIKMKELEVQMEALQVRQADLLNSLKTEVVPMVGAQFKTQTTAAVSNNTRVRNPVVAPRSLKS